MGRIAGQEEEEEEGEDEEGTISALSVRSGHSGRRGLDLSSQVRDPPPPLPADLPAIIASIPTSAACFLSAVTSSPCVVKVRLQLQ